MRRTPSLKALTLNSLLLLATVAMTLIAIEGFSSLTLFIHDSLWKALGSRSVWRYTRVDPQLGWTNIPGIEIPNMYGPGIGLTIDAQGFRGKVNVTAKVMPGRFRIICSGDSFTFGYGVDDDHTWCHLLTTLDKRFESVDMGQSGYGIDQAYLWYLRDGTRLDHSLLLFAFITDDLRRMQNKWAYGYGKPVLKVHRGGLVVDNVPVPPSGLRPWISRVSVSLHELRTLQLVTRLVAALRRKSISSSRDSLDLALKVFDELARSNARTGSELVLVYLPTESDYYPETDNDGLRRDLSAAIKQKGIVFIDLIEDFRKMPAGRIWELFIPEGVMPYVSAAGHYSVKGNEWAAQTIYAKLRSDPATARILGFGRE